MFGKMPNQKTVTVKITRGELCDLKLACLALDKDTPEETAKWAKLHEKLQAILDEHDEKQDELKY